MRYHHEKYMKMALELAERGRFSVSPNPLVGCVLVKDDRVIGSGFHEKAGCPHAESNALLNATDSTLGATAYVTLEPCMHVGRTAPCAPLLVDAGIKTVYVALLDPNPLVYGKGVAYLRQAGIQVHVGLCEEEAIQQNRFFSHFIQHKMPFVIAKWAMSLDGKISVQPNDNKQLSSHDALQEAHRLRHEVDAILIGSGTAIQDNPALTVRYQEVIMKHPIRIVLCGETLLPLNLRLFTEELPGETWVVTRHDVDAVWRQNVLQCGVKVIPCDTEDGRISLPALMRYLGASQITSVLVEGGTEVLNAFFAAGLVNESRAFITPYVIGKLPHKEAVTFDSMQQLGSDYYVVATHEVRHV